MFHKTDETFFLVYPNSQVIQTFQDFVGVMKGGNADICFGEVDAAKAVRRLGQGFRVVLCKGKEMEDVTGTVKSLVRHLELEDEEYGEEENKDEQEEW